MIARVKDDELREAIAEAATIEPGVAGVQREPAPDASRAVLTKRREPLEPLETLKQKALRRTKRAQLRRGAARGTRGDGLTSTVATFRIAM